MRRALLIAMTRVRFELDSLLESEEGNVLSISQQGATGTHEPGSCGFSSCTEYIRRLYWINASIAITWPKGAPEDKVVLKLDEFELRV